jgi:hypothetical protein
MRSAAGSFSNSVVDIYNSVTGAWSTAVLSVARVYIEATSAGKMALFAGGYAGPAVLSNVVDAYNSITGLWSTAVLSVARYGLAAASVGNVALFAGGAAAGAVFHGYCARIMYGSCGFVSHRVECL